MVIQYHVVSPENIYIQATLKGLNRFVYYILTRRYACAHIAIIIKEKEDTNLRGREGGQRRDKGRTGKGKYLILIKQMKYI